MGPALVYLCQERSLPSLSAISALCVLSFGHSPDSGRPKNVRLIQRLWNACLINFAFTYFHITHGQRQVSTSALTMHHSFALSEQLTPVPHIFSVHITFSMHWTMCLWIYAGWTFLVFKNLMTGSTSQVAGFLIVIFNGYGDWRGKWWHRTMQYPSPLFCKRSSLPLWATFSELLFFKTGVTCLLAYWKRLSQGQRQGIYHPCSCYAW